MATRQTTTAPAPTGTAYLVGRLHRLLRRHLEELLLPLGITVQQYTMLAVLDSRGQLSNAQLAERAFVTPQTANEIVKAMEANGWVERTPDPNHGRIIQIKLAKKGRDALARAHTATAKLENEMLADISPEDRQCFQDQLKSAIHALSFTMIGGNA
jgi:DNA-binding MarR family transcriptional regulator